MDGYAFATVASEGAIQALKSDVSSDNDGVRVVLPVSGTHALYVAVTAATEAGVDAALAAVAATDGLSGVTSSRGTAITLPVDGAVPDLPWVDETLRGATPTWLAVSGFVGFALLGYAEAEHEEVLMHVASETLVVGVAALSGGQTRLLVEVTSDTRAAVETALSALSAMDSVTAIGTMVGEAQHGVGLTLR